MSHSNPTAKDRLQILITKRDQKMARSAHAYMRGNTLKFYEWLESTAGKALPDGPPVWICGDCHVGNLGPIANIKGEVAIQIRDLDQTVIGNPAHDLIRLGLSLATAVRSSNLPGITTAHMIENMTMGYEGAFLDRPKKETQAGTNAATIQRVLQQALRRRWKHLAGLFPWLAQSASFSQMKWFLAQEVAGEAGFDDLVAMTQVKMPVRAKLEMARNYWDEMGRGDPKGMHGPMLEKLADHLDICAKIDTTVPEALALGNMMMALAVHRKFAFHSVGALGVIEMTAPGRATYVAQGLDRLGVSKKHSNYFALHAILDVKHSEAWNNEVIRPLVEEEPRRARPIAEGALMRLWCGEQCFKRYRANFSLNGAARADEPVEKPSDGCGSGGGRSREPSYDQL